MQLLMPKTIQLSMQAGDMGWEVKVKASQLVQEAEACFWMRGVLCLAVPHTLLLVDCCWIHLNVLNHTAKHLI